MTDILKSLGIMTGQTGAFSRMRDMGDNSHAEVVALAGSGIVGSASFTPAADAYGAGDIMDVAQEIDFTFAGGAAVPAGSLIRISTVILRLDISALQESEAAYTLQCYGVTPPSAQADNAAWTLASADLPSYLGAISLGTPVDLGAALFVKTTGLTLDFKLTGSSVFAELVTVAGFTATAVAREVLLYGHLI
jgi:hypothetical protein